MPKRIAFIAPYPIAQAPSQRFRFEQYFNFLEENNCTYAFFPFYDFKSWQLLYTNKSALRKAWVVLSSYFKRFSLIFKLRKFDVIFIHREATHIGPPIIEWIIAKILKKKYIYDFDDAIWLPNYSEGNSKFHRLKAYWKVKYCIKWAHRVSAGNAFLANYASQFNDKVIVLPTTIDTENYHNLKCQHDKTPIIIGWTGTHTTMQYLQTVVPVLQEIEEKYQIEIHIISNEKPVLDLKSLVYVKWKKETEIEDLVKFSIGIMPLEDNVWAEGKCGFKGLQYMALEIPTIMSAVGVNKTIVNTGVNGFLVSDSNEWKKALVSLIEDHKLRTKIGQAGYESVKEHYSVVANTSLFLSLFEIQN
jgi:glycosyltransferase involved in cell wall biosynthesis